MGPRLSLVITLATLASACEPKPPACSDVSMHVGEMFRPPDEYSREIEGAFLGRCINDEWSADVRRCILATLSLEQPQNCKSKMTPAQAAALDKDLTAVEDRQESRVMPQACLDLEVQIAVAQSCEAIPKPVRDQMMTNLAASKAKWANVVDKRGLGPICGAAIQSLKQATIECAKPAPSPAPAPSLAPGSAPK